MVAYVADHIVGSKILAASVSHRRFTAPQEIVGQTIKRVTRRAKYMLFHLDDGIVVTHNRFTGYWEVLSAPWTFDYLEFDRVPKDSDVRILWNLELANGKRTDFRFHDMRCLGFVAYHAGITDPNKIKEIGKLGPEVVETKYVDPAAQGKLWTFDKFQKDLRMRSMMIKEMLLDQKYQAGVGNIYVCEALWRAGISPWRFSQTLTAEEAQDLYAAVKDVILAGLANKVQYDNYIKVFRVKRCEKCQGEIVRGVMKSRGTYYCPRCQPGPVTTDQSNTTRRQPTRTAKPPAPVLE